MDVGFIFTGLIVGGLVGLTGVGGGAIMTPTLILGFGIAPIIAVGTDLLYAAISKSSGVIVHHHHNHVQWTIVKLFAMGSLPAAMLTSISLSHVSSEFYEGLLQTLMGVMLLLTAITLFARPYLQNSLRRYRLQGLKRDIITILAGAALGVLVTLTSVGAGALGVALISLLYPQLSSRRMVGTDLAHAVPLTAVAGMGHWQLLGSVDWQLLVGLLIGAIPGIMLGSLLTVRIPPALLRNILATLLFLLGLRFAF
ncbi:sulfite exporter TauE/SafE family protein [Candidatus Albibeggiatoa sp. nov. NOAA]|uniref:sulfite exporter TauE/SafE family protein n=1 Tax=Candidatus Albibeggiatoa sp. nov. NOAA TaxID=3162724 RepID=UPI0032FD0937|nr:sulfite exporter TauE/SafE family protein [Thiotrichaceae bacterium]